MCCNCNFSSQSYDVVKRRAVKNLFGRKAHLCVGNKTRTEALCELRLLSKNDAESRPLIAEADAVPLIAESLYSPAVILQENATATLLNLSISSKEHLMSSHGVLDALSHALRHPPPLSFAPMRRRHDFSLFELGSFPPHYLGTNGHNFRACRDCEESGIGCEVD
ncbi:hypothetical protein Salat_2868800 [Sesamum alatum]|uniref:Uncharacterized protein n=1 Tax=Sesamum alatum TaxID=300844 RepID=A0AAE2CA19_9LAMI|nr:hypothetical protein Salat_2868800 [Sesamum alatum]